MGTPKHALTTILLLLLILPHAHPAGASTPPANTFILTSCKTTTYPSLCIKSLTPYAASVGTNRLKLCNAALNAAINAATACSAAVSQQSNLKGIGKPEARAVKECVGDLKDAIYELKRTTAAMKHLSDGDREFEWANAKTYASAAITDAETCVDGFMGRKVNVAVKKKIRSCISGTEKCISNALSLINSLYS